MPSTAPAPVDIDYQSLRHLLPQRARDAHKGDFGHVLVVGGDQGLGGAALMAAEAAARCGAGLVSVATHPAHLPAFLARRPELMVRGLANENDLLSLLERATVLVLGPGLGQSSWSRRTMEQVLQARARQGQPLVLDADGLNLLSQGQCGEIGSDIDDWILTPHPGEAARLLGQTSTEVQAQRPAAIAALQRRYGGVCILKGAGSLICYKQDEASHLDRCCQGNPGMASGGMGDILSGVLGGLIAQGLTAADAARLGVCLHAAGGDAAARANGERGLLACDLLPWIQRLANPEPA